MPTTLGLDDRRLQLWEPTEIRLRLRALDSVEPTGELGARAHAELRVHLRERRLDGAQADEQARSNLLVRQPARDELCDLLLTGRQPRPVGRPPARESGEVCGRLLGPASRAERVEALECVDERGPRGAPVPCAPL